MCFWALIWRWVFFEDPQSAAGPSDFLSELRCTYAPEGLGHTVHVSSTLCKHNNIDLSLSSKAFSAP